MVKAAVAVGADAGQLHRFTHGTTIATNALLERKGARTAFIGTAGFEHVLHLRRQARAHLYRLCDHHPDPPRSSRPLHRRPRARRAGRGRRAARSRLAARPGRGGRLRLPALLLPRLDARAARRRRCAAACRPRTWSPRTRWRRSSGSTNARRRQPWTPTSGPFSPTISARWRRAAARPACRSRSSCGPLEASARSPRRPGTRRWCSSRARLPESWAPLESRNWPGSRTRSRSTWAGRRPTSA